MKHLIVALALVMVFSFSANFQNTNPKGALLTKASWCPVCKTNEAGVYCITWVIRRNIY